MTTPELAAEELGLEAYRALYEHSPYGVLFTAPDGRVLAANPAACVILGLDEAEIRRRGRQELIDPTDERWLVMLDNRAAAGRAHGVGRMVRGDGTRIDVEISSQVFGDGRGASRTCTVIRDVTARLRIERELMESRERLAEAEHIAGMGSWEWDLGSGRTTWSDGLHGIYRLDRGEFDPTLEGATRRVYPDDRDRVRHAIERAVEQRSSFTLEYRAVCGDGRVRTFRSHGDVVVDDDGEPVRLVGVVQDVTEVALARQVLESTSADLERRAGQLQRLARHSGPPRQRIVPLTTRQLEIVRLIADGLTNAEIAERLVVTEGTVKWHVKQILAKTQSSNRAEAIARVLGDLPHSVEDLSIG